MRQIKFRAWDTQDNRYIDDFTNYAAWEARGKGENAWRDDRYIKEQFTGLLDKDGNLLDWWEGDVFEINTLRYELIYMEGAFWFINRVNNKKLLCRDTLDWAGIENAKIGNIHTGETK